MNQKALKKNLCELCELLTLKIMISRNNCEIRNFFTDNFFFPSF